MQGYAFYWSSTPDDGDEAGCMALDTSDAFWDLGSKNVDYPRVRACLAF